MNWVCLKYSVHVWLWKQILGSNLLHAHSNLGFFWQRFVTLRSLIQFLPKITLTNLQKRANIYSYLITFQFFFAFPDAQVWVRTYFQKTKVDSSQGMTVLDNWSCSKKHKKQIKFLQTIIVKIFNGFFYIWPNFRPTKDKTKHNY